MQTLYWNYRMQRLFETVVILAILAVCLAMVPKHAFGQDVTLKVATGSTAGTYHQMFTELNSRCSDTISLSETISKGSLDNLGFIIGNKVNAAVIQEDILFLKKRSETVLGNYRTLFVLHPEEVHFIALTAGKQITTTTKKWGIMNDTQVSQQPPLTSINELAGRTVASFGGSIVTAQIIQLQTQIPYTVQEVGNDAEAVNALLTGTVDAIVAVGGAQLPWVDKLDKRFKILEVPESAQSRMKDVYQKASLSYPNMGVSGIPTVATSAVFITRQYKTPEYVKALGALRSCLYKNLDFLKEKDGMHPKWQLVKGTDEEGYKGTFTWFDLPGSTPNVVRTRK